MTSLIKILCKASQSGPQGWSFLFKRLFFSFLCSCVQQMQTADLQTVLQVNEVNIDVKCSNRFPIPKLDFQKTRLKFRDRESVKAFHKNIYLVYLPKPILQKTNALQKTPAIIIFLIKPAVMSNVIKSFFNN